MIFITLQPAATDFDRANRYFHDHFDRAAHYTAVRESLSRMVASTASPPWQNLRGVGGTHGETLTFPVNLVRQPR